MIGTFVSRESQTPNTIDQFNNGLTDPLTGNPLPPTDQRALIKTFNIAPVWTRLISSTTLFLKLMRMSQNLCMIFEWALRLT